MILLLFVVSVALIIVGRRKKPRRGGVLRLTPEGMLQVAAGKPLRCGCRIPLEGPTKLCQAHQIIVEAS